MVVFPCLCGCLKQAEIPQHIKEHFDDKFPLDEFKIMTSQDGLELFVGMPARLDHTFQRFKYQHTQLVKAGREKFIGMLHYFTTLTL